MKHLSPLAALCGGIAAGLVGSLAQDIFFALTKRLAPSTPRDVFEPPEPEQKQESSTQTIARRAAQGLLARPAPENKERAGRLVHYAYGAAWGGLYGLLAESARGARGLRGGILFGLGVWLASDFVLLPLFRLAASPRAYPAKTHAYSIAAHAVYGAAAAEVMQASHSFLDGRGKGRLLFQRP